MANSFSRLDDSTTSKSLQTVTSGSLPMVIHPKNLLVGFLVGVLNAFLFVINTFSIPFRLLMRKNMGERAFTVLAFFLSLACFAILIPGITYLGYSDIIGINFYFPEIGTEMYLTGILFYVLVTLINPYTIFIVILLEKGRIHFSQALERARNKEYQYSFEQGDSIYFERKRGKKFWGFEVKDDLIRMLYEPTGMISYSLPIVVLKLYPYILF